MASKTKHNSKYALLKSPNTSKLVLIYLSKDKNPSIRIKVAKHKNTPQDVLDVLSKDLDLSVREAVAKNDNTPSATLAFLVKNDNDFIKWQASSNKNCSKSTLNYLAKYSSKDYHTAFKVAANDNSSRFALETILNGPNAKVPGVCLKIANHPHTSETILKRLLDSEDLEVKSVAFQKLVKIKNLMSFE